MLLLLLLSLPSSLEGYIVVRASFVVVVVAEEGDRVEERYYRLRGKGNDGFHCEFSFGSIKSLVLSVSS